MLRTFTLAKHGYDLPNGPHQEREHLLRFQPGVEDRRLRRVPRGGLKRATGRSSLAGSGNRHDKEPPR